MPMPMPPSASAYAPYPAYNTAAPYGAPYSAPAHSIAGGGGGGVGGGGGGPARFAPGRPGRRGGWPGVMSMPHDAVAAAQEHEQMMRVRVKEYRCDFQECGLVFKSSGGLSRHQRIHLNIRPYSCPIEGCTATFHRIDNMKAHHASHARRIGKPLMGSKAISTGNRTPSGGTGTAGNGVGNGQDGGAGGGAGGGVGVGSLSGYPPSPVPLPEGYIVKADSVEGAWNGGGANGGGENGGQGMLDRAA
ncbi:hypothetical protein M427DRAFT_334848 [Gonapodya prolifera JEL478]|uniref:C2H2-type domain-containing protein n=1 Tax=Gonapodya prolifera (strain JEL478) TaxID=1344416 RepID=A0A139AEE6_GONPJ|nr:hypothetical protein M427DRAFT_334848 [Gonapodya prolifera JEL478]|eukprot:KXS14815.1 hypothetical protein M427DRAFT_334848 [Gonapodya prolifera JEL478]